ncbi:MAG: hypothetical protein WCG60_00410 [bacterium]
MESFNNLLREQKKEKLKDTISIKIDFIISLHNLLFESMNRRLSSAELKDILQNKFIEFCQNNDFDQASLDNIRKNINEYFILREEYEKTKNLPENVEILDRNKLIDKKAREINTYLGDNNNDFIYRIESHINDIEKLREKSEKLEFLYKNDTVEFRKIINKIIAGKNDKEIDYFQYVKNIEFDGLTTKITVSRELSKILPETSKINGWTPRRGSTYFIYEDAPIETNKHEFNHIIYSYMISHKVDYSDGITNWINGRITASNDENQDDFVLLANGIKKSIEKCDEFLFGEILADLDRIFYNNNISGFYFHFMDTLSALYKIKIGDKIIHKKELEEVLRESIKNLEVKSNEKFKQLRLIVYLAKKFNLLEECKASIILYGDDLRKISRYIKDKLGEDDFNKSKADFDNENPDNLLKTRR